MAKKKYYVVWIGRQTGIFETWEDCNKQIFGFPKAQFKSFATKELAEKAFNSSSKDFIGKDIFETVLNSEQLALIGEPIKNSIAVDGAWNTTSGIVEYQGIHTDTGEIIFRVGPYEDGTNNIVEFLAIVHALAYCKQNNLKLPIYSDSKSAISWVRAKQARTNHQKSDKNNKLFELIDRAIKWLNENNYDNEILKWETRAWGENPADFGRK
ncbi:ribonuclease H1 domain-containing protein [Flavobacterium agrisoli]|uniref:Ribonuclease H n=1 Tax=Flavobacterium agrisoli TaxID=2793066 RepID=A0A934PQB9_9FLAO|nr:ribonuclease H family protein [Flavobacterium agrisoli]MBK0371135.1 ribonuclease H family protein [Flavobacterium agrisoli]